MSAYPDETYETRKCDVCLRWVPADEIHTDGCGFCLDSDLRRVFWINPTPDMPVEEWRDMNTETQTCSRCFNPGTVPMGGGEWMCSHHASTTLPASVLRRIAS